MSALRRYLLPGFIFQSVVIAGGYGTGREIAEYFLAHGPRGGLLAMAVSTAVFSAVCIASYEFARVFRAFDYRAFFQRLLGPGWILFEILYLALLMIVMAVIAAAAGAVLDETFGLPRLAGTVGMMILVGALVFGGNRAIERAFASWSGVLYAVYLIFFVWCAARFGPQIQAAFAGGEVAGAGWILGGLQYAGYNLGVFPAVLIAVRHHRSRRDTFAAGLLTGPLAMLPALLFFTAMAAEHPQIAAAEVPANHMLELLGSRTFQVVFQIVLFGTLAETGAGMIHAVNERLAGAFRDRGRELPRRTRAAAALVILSIGALVAQFGLVALIARGYGTITYPYLAVFVVPVLTWGVHRARRERAQRERAQRAQAG